MSAFAEQLITDRRLGLAHLSLAVLVAKLVRLSKVYGTNPR